MWIATADHMRTLERRATDEFGIEGHILMERAGRMVFDHVREMLPGGGRISVLCGRGNNGGDGFVTARAAREHGYQVECLVAGPEDGLRDDAAAMMRCARAQGVRPIFEDDRRFRAKLEGLASREVIVDALLGTGPCQEVRAPVADAISAINRSGVPVISVDVPSGIHADTGDELGDSVWATRTVTFGLPKRFLFQGIGLEHAGDWVVADIGLPDVLLGEPTDAQTINDEWVAHMLPDRMRDSHKGQNGSVLVVAGSRRMRGAAVLAALAALRSGAGLVTVASVASVCQAVAANLPEAMLLELPEEDGEIAAGAAEMVLELTRPDAAVFGPGMGMGPSVDAFLGSVWSEWKKPCVIDADALNAVSRGVRLPVQECVLTPHPGEMSRLMRASIAEVQATRFQTARRAAQQFNQCVLLKGPYSITSVPNRPMLVNDSGNAGMATGGMGDVLSGVVATLLAQDLPAYYAAGCGMYWHGLAGDVCASEIGGYGYRASELASSLPCARARILKACAY